MMPKKKSKCERCGKEFDGRRKFCSAKCRYVGAWPKICVQCGSHVSRSYWMRYRHQAQVCSEECRRKYWERSCEHCGKTLPFRESQSGNRAKFCSTRCRSRHEYGTRTPLPEVRKTCLHCGAALTHLKERLLRKYCSKKCKVAANRPSRRISYTA